MDKMVRTELLAVKGSRARKEILENLEQRAILDKMVQPDPQARRAHKVNLDPREPKVSEANLDPLVTPEQAEQMGLRVLQGQWAKQVLKDPQENPAPPVSEARKENQEMSVQQVPRVTRVATAPRANRATEVPRETLVHKAPLVKLVPKVIPATRAGLARTGLVSTRLIGPRGFTGKGR